MMNDLQVTGNGSLQLGGEVITNYDLLAKLSPALSNRVTGVGGEDESGGAGIGKFIRKITSVTGTLFMEQGSIVVPLRMTGPIRQPTFALNTEVLQKRATERFVGKPTEKFTERKLEDAIKGVTDMFKKKPKP
jgi:hypothetical protein